jgi:hypothetical protein
MLSYSNIINYSAGNIPIINVTAGWGVILTRSTEHLVLRAKMDGRTDKRNDVRTRNSRPTYWLRDYSMELVRREPKRITLFVHETQAID